MPERIRFTKSSLESIEPPDSGRRTVYDDRQPGLCIRISDSGERQFYVYRKHNGRPLRIRLGRFPDISIEQARKLAQKHIAEMATGENPNAVKRKQRTRGRTFGDVWGLFIDDARSRKAEKSWREDQRNYERFLKPWAKLELSRPPEEWIADVERLHRKIGQEHGQVQANRVRSIVSRVFSLAQQRRLWLHMNPVQAVPKFAEQSRERFVQQDEIGRLFDAIDAESNEAFRDLFKIAIFTGCRIGNVCSMKWSDLALQRQTWTIPRTKNGTSQTVHLHAEAVAILDRRQQLRELQPSPSEYVFPATRSDSKNGHIGYPQQAWKRIRERSGMPDLRPHDLRRTLGSWAINAGVSDAIVGKALNHKSRQATEIYTRVAIDPVRQAIDKTVNAMLQSAEGGRTDAKET